MSACLHEEHTLGFTGKRLGRVNGGKWELCTE